MSERGQARHFTRMTMDRSPVTNPAKIGHYCLLETIGEGSCSLVKRAVDEYTGKEYACKIVPRTTLLRNKLEKRFEIEIRILQKMRHPGIASLYDLYSDSLNYYVILEYCSCGSLFQYMTDHKHICEETAKFIFKQIAQALKYVHDHGIAHRDLKPENILIDGATLRVKIIDFGFAQYGDTNGLMKTMCGSLSYISPECATGEWYNGMKSDIWSLGVTLYMIRTGTTPWTRTNHIQLVGQIVSGDYFICPVLGSVFESLAKGMMNVDPNERMTIDDVLQHEWLKDVKEVGPDDTDRGSVEERFIDEFFDGYLVPFALAHGKCKIRSAATLQEGRRLLRKVGRRISRNNWRLSDSEPMPQLSFNMASRAHTRI